MRKIFQLIVVFTILSLLMIPMSVSAQKKKPKPPEPPGIDPFVAAGQEDGTLHVFDLKSGTLLWQDNVGSPIHGVDIRGEFILVGAEDGVFLFNVDHKGSPAKINNGVRSGTWYIPDNHPVSITEEYFAVAHSDNTVAVYKYKDAKEHSISKIWSDYLSGAKTVEIAFDSTAVIAGGSMVKYYDDGGDGWDDLDSSPLFEDNFFARIVSIAGDGQHGVAGHQYNGMARIYSKTGEALNVMTIGGIVTAAISSDGTIVAVGNDDPSDSMGAKLNLYSDGGNGWDVGDSVPICSYRASTDRWDDIRAITLSETGQYVSSGGVNKYRGTHIIDTSCNVLIESTFKMDTLSLDTSLDGYRIASCGGKKVCVNYMGSNDPLWTFTADSSRFHAVAISKLIWSLVPPPKPEEP